VKTISLKKVSAVAVASLGFGLLSVAPANADAVTAASIVETISLAKVTTTPTTGTAVEVNLGLKVGALTGETDADTLNIRGYLSSYPAGAFAQVTASATAVGTDSEIGVDAQSADSGSGSSYIVTFTDSSEMGTGETVTATAAVGIGKYSFTPSAAGTYVLTVWADSDGDTVVDITEAVQTISLTVVAAAGYSSALSTAFMVQDLTDADNSLSQPQQQMQLQHLWRSILLAKKRQQSLLRLELQKTLFTQVKQSLQQYQAPASFQLALLLVVHLLLIHKLIPLMVLRPLQDQLLYPLPQIQQAW